MSRTYHFIPPKDSKRYNDKYKDDNRRPVYNRHSKHPNQMMYPSCDEDYIKIRIHV